MSHWWETTPWRMIQTNLREPDMEDIDAKRFAHDLQSFGATVVMVNAAGIVASYDTAVPDQTQSEYLKGDSLQAIVEECHKAGLKVIARTDFSKVRRPVLDRHPEWAFRGAKGELFDCNGDVQVCPNSAYQTEVVLDILKELFTRLPFDGVFFNMSGAFVTGYDGTLYGPCMCDTCKRLYKEATGQDAPAGGMRDPGSMRYVGFQAKRIGMNKARQYAFLKKLDPELAVNGFDYMRTESNTDIGRPAWLYGAASNARSSGQRVVDNAAVDFIAFRYRDTAVSPALTELRLWQSLANGGGLSYYLMGRLDNHRDTSGFAAVKKVFAHHKEHEALYAGLVSAAPVLLVQKGGMSRDDPEAYGWLHALTQSHIPFDECKLQDLSEKALFGKKVVLLADIRTLNAEQAALLDAFAGNGGTVLATGDTGIAAGRDAMALKCLGVAELGVHWKGLMSSALEVTAADAAAFPRSAASPIIALGGDYRKAVMAPDTETWLRLIPEHPYGPPERCFPVSAGEEPGVTVHTCGAGRGIWLPALLGSFYFQNGWQNTLNLMQDILFGLCGLPELAPGLSPMAELTLRQKEGCTVVQLVNESGCFANHWFAPLPMRDVVLYLPGMAGKKAETLCGGKLVCQVQGDDLLVTLDVLNAYEAVVLT